VRRAKERAQSAEATARRLGRLVYGAGFAQKDAARMRGAVLPWIPTGIAALDQQPPEPPHCPCRSAARCNRSRSSRAPQHAQRHARSKSSLELAQRYVDLVTDPVRTPHAGEADLLASRLIHAVAKTKGGHHKK